MLNYSFILSENQPFNGFFHLGAMDIISISVSGDNPGLSFTEHYYNYSATYIADWGYNLSINNKFFDYENPRDLNRDNIYNFTITIQYDFGRNRGSPYTLATETVNYQITVTDFDERPVVYGDDNVNTLSGSANDEQLRGFGGNDTLYAFSGKDKLDGGAGYDKMYGGDGDDTYIFDSRADQAYELVNEGTDTIVSEVASITLAANIENGELLNKSNPYLYGSAISLTGNTTDNRLTGNDLNNMIDGKAGADFMAGGKGNDSYIIDSVADTVLENMGEGTDIVKSALININLITNVENATLTGRLDLNITGNDLDNVLVGNTGNNILLGGLGNDTLTGGRGGDQLYGGAGADKFNFSAEIVQDKLTATDVIFDFSHAEADQIALNRADANTVLAGNQAFAFLGAAAFTGVAGQLNYAHSGGNTTISGDTNGDGIADFNIVLSGLYNLTAADFVL